MKSDFIRAARIAALLFSVASAAQSQAPANTGASANVVGGVDTRWQVSTNNGLTWIQAFQVQNPPGVWQANTSEYSWISATPSGSGGGGDYFFRMFFDLGGYNPASVMLSFLCAIDNERAPGQGYYSLNGGPFGGTCGSGATTNFKFAGEQTINSGFVSGINELEFHVTGDSQTDGLVVGNIDLVGSTVPEPMSMSLVATGLIGLYGAARRRRNSLPI